MKYSVLFCLCWCLHFSCFAQEKCFTFQIGNGLSFLSKDSILVSRATSKKDGFGKPIYQIFLHVRTPNGWSEERNMSFSNGDFTDYHPEAYGDSIIFFVSRRPEKTGGKGLAYGNLWFVIRQNEGWSNPTFITELNENGHDTYPSFTKSGNLYFNSDRPNGKGSMDIYVSRYFNGKFSQPKPLIELNSIDSENDLVVDPMERFMIFNRYSFSTKELDLFISKKENERWGKPKLVSIINKPNVYELTPTLSIDSELFYYEINGSVFCIELGKVLNE